MINNLSEEELEEKVERLSRLGKRLHLFVPVVRYKIVSSVGDRILDTREGISRSWNRNAYNWVTSIMSYVGVLAAGHGAGVLSFLATNGSYLGVGFVIQHYISNYYSNETDIGYRGVVDTVTGGIVVGTGTGPDLFNDYKLGTQILSGTTTGKLSYQASVSPTKTWDSDHFDIVWKRYFNNNSGGNIDIAETGIYSYMGSSSSLGYYMPCRDVISPAVTVDDGGQLYVEYTISLTYP